MRMPCISDIKNMRVRRVVLVVTFVPLALATFVYAAFLGLTLAGGDMYRAVRECWKHP